MDIDINYKKKKNENYKKNDFSRRKSKSVYIGKTTVTINELNKTKIIEIV